MDEQEALLEFLRRYRETPHSTKGVSPNHLLLGFSRSSGIPSMVPETPEQREVWRKNALANDARAKKRMEADYNMRIRVREPVITVGSKVLVKLSKHRKNTSAWDVVNPYTATEISGSIVTAQRDDGRKLTRNSSTFKLYRSMSPSRKQAIRRSHRTRRGGKRLRQRVTSRPQTLTHSKPKTSNQE